SDGTSVKEDFALVRMVGAGEDLDQGRLAGAVVADEGADLTRVERKVGAGQRFDVAEPAPDAARLEERRQAHGMGSPVFSLPCPGPAAPRLFSLPCRGSAAPRLFSMPMLLAKANHSL